MTIMDYIKEQPAVFAKALDSRKQYSGVLSAALSDGRIARIYIIASGTSRNAALAASPFISELIGLDVSVISPTSMPQSIKPGTLVIYISQGGASTNTISALRNHPDVPGIVLTSNLSSKICEYSRNIIEIPCGPENVGPKTKGYTVTVLQLYLMFIEAASELGLIDEAAVDAYLAVLKRAGDAIEGNIERSIAWTESNIDGLSRLSAVYIAGKDQGAAVAYEGALKIMETLLIPAFGFEFEEYLHGPVCSLSDMTGGVYLMPSKDSPDRKRFSSLVQHHRTLSSEVFAIGESVPDDKRDLDITMTGESYTVPFELILPFQVVSSLIPIAKGIDGEGSRRFAHVDSLVSTKCR